MPEDVFGTNQDQGEPKTEENPFRTQLIGDGKKYRDDEELAKAYVHADNHIGELTSENANLRKKLEESTSASEVLQEIKKQNAERDTGNTTQEISQGDIVSLVKDVVTQTDKDKTAQANLDTVSRKLLETYGDQEKTQKAVADKARELGVSVEFLKSTGGTSPSAFFNLMGVGTAPSADAEPSANTPQSTVNTAALQGNAGEPEPGTAKWYSKLRKENPKAYRTPRVQMQMLKDREDKGPEGFYK